MTGSWTFWRPLPGILLLLLSLSGCATFGRRTAPAEPEAAEAKQAPLHPLKMTPEQFLRNARGTYVVVDLDENRLRVMDGELMLWEAPVGTGTGLRLKGPDGEWHFSTPRGVFQIQYKEEMPVWILPDWYFVEKKQRIPPLDSPLRRAPGQLGVAAVFIGAELAIHGTERPELLGQRVSHGCIRLANENALRLYHNVQIGTPVVIIGGEHLDDEPPGETTDPGRPRRQPKPDALAGVPTPELLRRLDRSLNAAKPNRDWIPLASRLITRSLKDDAPALRGLLERAGTMESETLRREYATFLADLYSRGSLRAVVSLARIEPRARDRAARAIVKATMALYPGLLEDRDAPWPTRRIPAGRLGPDGRKGWEALAVAEADYRTSDPAMAARTTR